jgi:hypothetical protein
MPRSSLRGNLGILIFQLVQGQYIYAYPRKLNHLTIGTLTWQLRTVATRGCLWESGFFVYAISCMGQRSGARITVSCSAMNPEEHGISSFFDKNFFTLLSRECRVTETPF